MFLPSNYTLQYPPKEKGLKGLNSDVSNLRHNRTNADLIIGKTRLNSENTCADQVTIHVTSRLSGKPAIARAAHVMANDSKWQQQRIDVRGLNVILEGMSLVDPIRRICLVSFRGPRTALARLYDHIQYIPVLTQTKTTARVVWIPSLANNPYRIPVRFRDS